MSTPTTESQAPPRPGLTLFAVCVAVLIVPLGLSGSPVALPAIGQDLDAGVVPLQWVVNSYNVMAASCMMAAGSFADLFGRKKIFAGGVVLYAASSLIAAMSPHILVLDVARGVAGIAAAAVMTAGAAALAAMYEGPARIRAFAMIGVTIGAGLALGPSTSGLLVSSLGWRSIFFLQAALALVSLLGFVLVRESRNPDAQKVDWPGTVTFTLALFLFTLAIVEGPGWGWGSPGVIGLFVASLAFFGLFVVAERRQNTPMFDLSLFRERKFMGVNLLATAVSFGFVGLMVLLPSYLVGATGVSDRTAGLTMLLLTAPILVFPMLAGKLVSSGVSMRLVLSAGLMITAIGCVWLTVVNPDIGWLGLLGPLVAVGVGIGLIYGLMDGAAVSTVPSERAGMAVGMFNTIRLATEAFAVAVMIAGLVSLVQSQIAAGLSGFAGVDGSPRSIADSIASGNVQGPVEQAPAAVQSDFGAFLADGYTDGLRIVLLAAAAICAIAAVAIYRMLGDQPQESSPESQREDEEVPARG